MLRVLRIAILLFALATVGQWAWLDRQRVVDWKETLRVVVYPIDADGSPQTAQYLRGLDVAVFRPIDQFLAAQAKAYGAKIAVPVEMRLGPQVASMPPLPPAPGASALASIAWSLRLRWWAGRNDRYDGPKPHVRLFVLYHDPGRSPRLGHSVGLEKGMIGIVRVFASRNEQSANNVVIAHELLHTFGATDKYDPATNIPLFPEGYADPDASPRWPQRRAEIMAGRIPRSATQAAAPGSLAETVIGSRTVAEIHWLR